MAGDDDVRRVDRRDRPDEFARAGQGRVAVYQGEQAVDVTPPAPVIASPIARKKWGLTRQEMIFMREMARGESRGVLADTWRLAFPKDKATDGTIRHKASRIWKSILSKVGEEEANELMGIGPMAIRAKTKALMDAKVVKVFLDPKTGTMIESKQYEDNTTQLNAMKFAAEFQGMVKRDGGGVVGQVIVNVVQYAPQGAPPWPGGGRS